MYARYAVAAMLVVLAGSYAGSWRDRADATRSAAGQDAALAQLRLINTSQAAYSARHGYYACTLAELGDQYGLIGRDLIDGREGGYSFSLYCTPAPGQPVYQVWATPITPEVSGIARYCTDATAVLRRSLWRFDLCSKARPVH